MDLSTRIIEITGRHLGGLTTSPSCTHMGAHTVLPAQRIVFDARVANVNICM